MVYLDNAATTPLSKEALSALIEVSQTQFGNASALYCLGRKSKDILEEARKIIAQCIGADSDEIFFTSCGTESNNWAINSGACLVDRIISSSIEHHAVLNPIRKLADDGMDVILLPVDSNCVVSQEALKHTLDGRKALVSIMFQNNETGVLQNIKEMVRLVHEDNSTSLFHTDAVQAIGHQIIDVHELGVDMLSASAHKFNGPKGVGFLYISKNVPLSPYLLGGGQEKGLRSGTENIAGIYSMAIALKDNTERILETAQHVKVLENQLLSELSDLGVEYLINGNLQNKADGVINLSINGIDAEGLLHTLDLHNICISLGSACNSKSKTPSHVLTEMGLDVDRIDSSIRISIGRYNSKEDISNITKCIKQFFDLSKTAIT